MKKIQRKLNKVLWLALICLFASSYSYAETAIDDNGSKSKDLDIMALHIALNNLIPGSFPDSIKKTPMAGIFEVNYGTTIYYFSKDANFMFTGDMVDTKAGVNLTERKRAEIRDRLKAPRAALIEAHGEENMIVYKAKDEKFKVTVFTDIDCPYCVKLHHEIPQYNALGITVRYMAYPRAGIGSSSYHKIVSVWCSDDRNQAMTDAKNKQQIAQKTCTNPVKAQLLLGEKLGVNGTPALFLSDGTSIPGYVSAARLMSILNKAKK